MKAFQKVNPEPGGARYQDTDTPTAEASEVIVRIDLAGICGTDVHVHRWVPWMAAIVPIPTIMGHEATGTVVETGPDVQHLRKGDRISVESHIWCGECASCKNGFAHVCPNTHYPGVDVNGVFAEYTALPEKVCRKIPDGLSTETAAMLEPFGVAVHATTLNGGVDRCAVLVTGCGPIGLMNIAAAKALGASKVIAADVNPLRLKAAEAMGADISLCTAEIPLLDQPILKEQVIDVALDYSGSSSVIEALAILLRPGGSLRLLAIPEEASPTFPYQQAVLKGIKIEGAHGRQLFSTWDIAEELLLTRKVDLNPVVSHRLPLAEAEKGFELIAKQEALKVLLEP